MAIETVSPQSAPAPANTAQLPERLTSEQKALEKANFDNTDIVCPRNLGEIMNIAKVMSASNMFNNSKTPQQAAAIMILGKYFDMTPMQALMSLFVINGKPGMEYPALAARIDQHPKFQRKITVNTPERAVVVIKNLETGEVNESEFTVKDAIAAGTGNMTKFPRNMLVARATANAVRWFCPEVLHGMSVYVPGEIPEREEGIDVGSPKDKLHADLIAKTAEEDPTRAQQIMDAELISDQPAFELNETQAKKFATACRLAKEDPEDIKKDAWAAGARDFDALFAHVDPNKKKVEETPAEISDEAWAVQTFEWGENDLRDFTSYCESKEKDPAAILKTAREKGITDPKALYDLIDGQEGLGV